MLSKILQFRERDRGFYKWIPAFSISFCAQRWPNSSKHRDTGYTQCINCNFLTVSVSLWN